MSNDLGLLEDIIDEDGFDVDIPLENDNLGPFCGIFGTSKYVELLQLYISLPDLNLNKSQLSRVLNISFNTTTKILNHLKKYDLVKQNQNSTGIQKIYNLNLESPVVQELDKLNLLLFSQEWPELNRLVSDMTYQEINIFIPNLDGLFLRVTVPADGQIDQYSVKYASIGATSPDLGNDEDIIQINDGTDIGMTEYLLITTSAN